MRSSGTVTAALATTLIGVAAAGCGSASKPSPSPPKSATTVVFSQSAASTATSASPSDYTGLLIKASDIHAPEPFTAGVPINNPDSQPGVTTTFSNHDRTQVITDSIQILPHPVAAAGALKAAMASRDGYVHGLPDPIAIGTGGTTISGPSPDGAKSVTVLMFTEGRAFVELEFDGPPDSLAPTDFVTDVGTQQDEVIKKGLAG
jgi:hypothetical protein